MNGLTTIPREASRTTGPGRPPLGLRPHTGRLRMQPTGRPAHRGRGVAPDPELVEAIAGRVVELLERKELPADRPRYIDAATVAHDYSVERDWVYANKAKLGAFRLGGPHGRLRFDREALAERLGPPPAAEPPHRRRKQRAPRPVGNGEAGRRDPRRKINRKTATRAGGEGPARAPERQHPGGTPE